MNHLRWVQALKENTQVARSLPQKLLDGSVETSLHTTKHALKHIKAGFGWV